MGGPRPPSSVSSESPEPAPRPPAEADWRRVRPDADHRRSVWILTALLAWTTTSAAYLLAAFVEPRLALDALEATPLHSFQTAWTLLLVAVGQAAALYAWARRSPVVRVAGHLVAWLPLLALFPLFAPPLYGWPVLPWFVGGLLLSVHTALLRVQDEHHGRTLAGVHAVLGATALILLAVLPMGILMATGAGLLLVLGGLAAVAGLGIVALLHQLDWRHAHVAGGLLGAAIALSAVVQFVLALPVIAAGLLVAAACSHSRPLPTPDRVRWKRPRDTHVDGFAP